MEFSLAPKITEKFAAAIVNVAGYATHLGRYFRQTVILIGCGLKSGPALMRWKPRRKSRKSFTVTTLQLENIGLL
jgi:hypothetical protein